MKAIGSLGIVILLSGALTAGASSSPETIGAETQIRAALARWVEAANRQDWKTTMEVWAPDLIGWYPGQPDDTYQREVEIAAHPKPSRT